VGALLTLIAATISFLHTHPLVVSHGQPGWPAVQTSAARSPDGERGLEAAWQQSSVVRRSVQGVQPVRFHPFP
jgi:hypothetical protein